MNAWTDAAGVEHGRARGEVRIASLVPSITELLFSLGLGEQVVARTTFCIHPAEGVARVPRVGGTKTVRIDRLLAARPSHVIMNVEENRREDAEAIAAEGPQVIVTYPREPLDNPPLYRLLGNVFDRADAAERLCAAFEAAHRRLAEAARRYPERRVLYLIWRDPWMAVSRGTYISRTLALAGLHTVPDDTADDYPEVSMDEHTLDDTDFVLFSSEPFPFKDKHLDEARALCGDARTPFAFIDGEMTSWYGSRAIAGLDYLREFVPALNERARSRHGDA